MIFRIFMARDKDALESGRQGEVAPLELLLAEGRCSNRASREKPAVEGLYCFLGSCAPSERGCTQKRNSANLADWQIGQRS